ncbi:MAG: hypothetical protein CVU91_00515 [Firmicutes bacterium HGW-Firmicutes-16]|nr:MAG: hypothetical protein CVU91_00515 [Firmicutes bacterium HGW-Firmicutes-16]
MVGFGYPNHQALYIKGPEQGYYLKEDFHRMKSLNRTLSLVLVLAMCLGMMGIASAATTFTDSETISYKEAVDVMGAIGVMNGLDTGKFDPTGNLTREQAAKIICYLTMSATAADKLTATVAPFTDVAADRWSAGSIAYCVQQGIIAGMGDGTFQPTANVTGYQFAKMLLVALGYDASIEVFVGASWSLNVAKRAFQAKLFDGNDAFVGTTALTREEAALYAKNTLLAETVSYATKGTNITTDGTTIAIGASAPEKGDTFMASYYSGLKVNGGTTRAYLGTNSDDYGRAANIWVLKGTEIGQYAVNSTLTYTSSKTDTNGVAEVTKALKGFTVQAGAKITVNGNTGAAVALNATTFAAQIAALTGNGTEVQISVDNDNAKLITGVAVIKTDLAKVSSVGTKSVVLADKSAVSPIQGTYTIKSDDDCYDAVKGLAVDDYVLVTPVWVSGTTYSVAKVAIPTQVTGYISTCSKNPNTQLVSVTLNSKAYVESAAKTSDIVSTISTSSTVGATLWIDSYGYAVHVKAASVSATAYIFVLDAYQSLVSNQIVNMAKGILTDGTLVDVEVDGVAAVDGTLYGATVSNDVYTLATASAHTTGTGLAAVTANKYVALKAGEKIESSDKTLADVLQSFVITPTTYTTTFTNYYSTSVKFIYVNTTSKTATVKTGVQSVSALPTNSYAIIEAKSSTNTTPVVSAVIFVDGIAATVASDALLFFPKKDAVASTLLLDSSTNKTVSYPVYVAYKNGEQVLVPTKSNIAANATYYAYATNDNVAGAYILGSAPYSATTATTSNFAGMVTGSFSDTLISLYNATPATLSNIDISSAKIVDVRLDEDKDLYPVTETAAGICEAANDNLTLSIVYNADTGAASLVYVLGRGVGFALTYTNDATHYTIYTDKACTPANAVTTGTVIEAGTTLYVKSNDTAATKSELTAGTPAALTLETAAVDGTSAAVYSFKMTIGALAFTATQS